jgi:hypothetical protein
MTSGWLIGWSRLWGRETMCDHGMMCRFTNYHGRGALITGSFRLLGVQPLQKKSFFGNIGGFYFNFSFSF